MKEILKVENINLEQKYTKPPSRFSEAALVRELEKKVLVDLPHMQI